MQFVNKDLKSILAAIFNEGQFFNYRDIYITVEILRLCVGEMGSWDYVCGVGLDVVENGLDA